MKINVNKITSVTLLASMMLSAVSSTALPVTAYGSETEIEAMTDTQTEAEANDAFTDVIELSGTEGSEESTEKDSEENIKKESESELADIEQGTDQSEKENADKKQVEKLLPTEQDDPEEKEQASVTLTTEASEEQIGLPHQFHVLAENPMKEDMQLRISFWEYEGTETDGNAVAEEELIIPCGDVKFPFCDERDCFSARLIEENGNVFYETFYLQEEWLDGELIARYFAGDIPAGCSFSEDILISNDLPETLVVSTSIYSENLPEKSDKCLLTWVEASDTLQETDYEESKTQIMETQESVQQESEEHIFSETIPEELKSEDFASKRLLVMTNDKQNIRESDHVIGNYDEIYLIEYENIEECMNAYVYYKAIADAVEPDAVMEIASDAADQQSKEHLTEKETNPVNVLSTMESTSFVPDGTMRMIALLDTGASASENVVDRVSLIDDVLEGHSHGNQMVAAIIGQNPEAVILSVRVMGNDGRGTVSAIVAGMEYAMEQGVSIINLSLSSKKNTMNAVLEAEIQKAVAMGIIVVGAAGNHASDAAGYMPGSVGEAYIIGACDGKGTRIASSNYGTTVDYNVTASTTSEAAAKFSGCVSAVGINALKVNEGILYTTDYTAPDREDTETEQPKDDTEDLPQEELEDTAGNEEEGVYPGKGSSISMTEKIWTRDSKYDLNAYNPYQEDENVSIVCVGEIPEHSPKAGEKFQVQYSCSLKAETDYYWNLFVTFLYTEDRSIATVGSAMLENLMPSIVNQERNEGYGGIVPEYVGTTVEGRSYTVLKDDPDFDVNGLLIDYNPETFKVNNLADDGGFDVKKAGTYVVTYEMSYFLYPEYTWFVENTVTVIEKENLEYGIYLSTSESTLLFRTETDSHYNGYGDLVKVASSEEIFTISCVDDDYEVAFSSSSDQIDVEICKLTEQEDGTKRVQIEIPETLNEAVIFSMYRPGYQSAKFFTGGGWADGENLNLEELAIDQLSHTDMEHLEDTLLGKLEEDDEAYMEIAASWTTVESKNISGRIKTGDANTTNYSWLLGRVGGCNTGTVLVTEKKDEISGWISEKGYNIDTKDLNNFKINCSSGHDYLALWPNSYYKATLKCYIQKKGDDYRLKITCSLHPASDSHGNYQGFYGSKTYSSLTNGARLRVYKRFADPDFMDINPDKYGYLKTTFAIYPASAYNPVTKVLDTTVTPESTISLSDKEDDSVYGDSDILDPGTYYVVETRRIAGCTQNTDIYGPVEIKESDSGVIKLQDKVNNADYSSMASNNWIYNYPMYFNGKILTKTDDSGLPVEGAIYKVEYSTAESADAFSASKTWYFKTDADGVLSYDHAHYVDSFTYNGKKYQSDPIIENAKKTVAMLPFGFVRMKEVMPPSDIYDIDANTYTIELVAKKDAAGAYTIRKLTVKGTIPTSVDNLRYWKLTVKKESKAAADVLGLNSYSLAGATFGVFSDQACTKRVQLYSDAKLTVKAAENVFKTDASGNTPIYYLKAGAGTQTYYVKELAAPAGHQIMNSPVSVTVTMPTDALQQKTASFTQGYSEPYDYMELDALVEKLSMHGNPVQDVVFKVCYYDDSSANAARIKKTWYLKSDAQGKIYLDQQHLYDGDATMKSDAFYTDPSSGKTILPIGGYVTIQEVKAPAQYQLDDTVHGFTTKDQKVTLQKLYNDLLPCKIRIKKYDATGSKPLSGVEFELKFVKAAQTDTASADTYTRLLKEGETKVLATDKNGELTFENLAQGTYEITEVKTVAGQTLLKDKITVELPIAMTKAEADQYGNVDFTNAKEDAGYTGKWFFYDCLYEITNDPQFKLPQTGGIGTWRYGTMGLVLLGMAGGIFIWGRKKKKTNLLSIEK